MPNRIIKESVCTSDTIDQMSWFEECFYTRLWTACDDYGRMDARPAILKSKLFPLKERLSLKDIQNALQKMVDIGCVRLYECDSKPYLYLPSWEVHQQVRAKRSKYPAPDESCNHMISDDIKCPRNPIQSESESESESEVSARARSTRFTPPTLEEVTAYVQERGSKVDPQGFIDFYASKGWLVGKTPMKDWKAACRNAEKWERWDKLAQGKPQKQDFQPDAARIKKNADWLDEFLSEQEKGGKEA